MRRRFERGFTLSGFIFFAVIAVVVVMIGFRVLPAYVEYFTVQKTLRQALQRSGDTLNQGEFRKQFDLLASADYVDSVHGSDVELTKDGNQIVATAAWQRTLPLVANVSLLLDFEASATK